MVPVAGLVISIPGDILVIQVLSTAIAAQIAYSYAFDAKDPQEEEFIERLVGRSFMAQAAKAGPTVEAAKTAAALHNCVNCSSKLRADHRLAAALEKLLKHTVPAGGRVSVQSVSKAVPVVSILIGAGMNSAILGASPRMRSGTARRDSSARSTGCRCRRRWGSMTTRVTGPGARLRP